MRILMNPIPMKKPVPLSYSCYRFRTHSYSSFSSGHSEDEILPSEDKLVSEHTEIILIELKVGISKFYRKRDQEVYLQILKFQLSLLKYLYHMLRVFLSLKK